MLAYSLYVVFVSAFVALVVLGHVLLLQAVWPKFLPSLRQPTEHPAPIQDDATNAISAEHSAPKIAA